MKLASLPLLFLLLVPALSQEVLPPANARIIANGEQGVLLQWPGSPKARYFVQIYAGQVMAVEQEVTGNSISVQLRPGLGYQWKVNLETKSGYQEVVSSRGFQVVNDTQVVVLGSSGGSGSYRRGRSSPDGEPGGPGLNLTATLNRVGSYVSLAITGTPANRLFYFAPGAGPLLLASRGGNGGDGVDGYDGLNAEFNFWTGFVTLPEPGGDGGYGGDGGPGGNISVVSNGLPVSDYLLLDTSGGKGGAGGRGGRGGAGASIPAVWQNRPLPQGYGYGQVRAPDGRDGAPGNDGPEGRVMIR